MSTSSGSPSTVESREASALASALPRRAASRAAVVTAPRRAVEIFESTIEEVSTADCRAYAVRALASALEACSPEMEASLLASMEASLLASSEASAAAVTAPRTKKTRAKKKQKKRKQGVPKKGVPEKKGKGVSFGKA